MSPEDFLTALKALRMTHEGFAEFLAEHGHPARDVARTVRHWTKIGPPSEIVVILSLLRGGAGKRE